ncbi:MAG: GNAT family N-acetyltransferase [Acholeplasmatales bacterium]|nr:GNAT family N-acetyltransferase [Acholeplasmatales bacterium]
MKLNKYELLNRSYSFVSFEDLTLTIAVQNKEDNTIHFISFNDVRNVIGEINKEDKIITEATIDDEGNKVVEFIVDNQAVKLEYTNYSVRSIKVFENYIALYEDELIEMSDEWEKEFSSIGYLKNESKDLENQRLIIALDTDTNKLVGYLYGHKYKTRNSSATIPENSKVFELEEIYVKKDYRSMGIGTNMFKAIEDKLKNEGVTYITLTTKTKDYKKIFHFYIEEMGMTFWHARLFKEL